MPHPVKPLSAEGAAQLERVRALCRALPETFEKEAWGEATFRVGNEKKSRMFAMFANNHHGDGCLGLWCCSDADDRRILLESEPETYFVPPYLGAQGWVGVDLESVDDGLLAECVEDAYRRIAPPRLISLLGSAADGDGEAG